MQILRTVKALRNWTRAQRAADKTVGLVSTMGALHRGHGSLIRAAVDRCNAVVVSVFVNPTQFGPNEDYARYPRTFEADCKLAKEAGATAVFAPAVEEIYTSGAETFVDAGQLSAKLDGGSRPGHFRGVATIVAKLFIAAEPDSAFFGQKDAAQVAVLRRMTQDLGFAIELVVCPIVREADGLALSSRNAYLSAEERRQALVLSRAVHFVASLFAEGERNSEALREAARGILATEPAVRVDYLELVDWKTLEPVDVAAKGSLFAVAAWVGATRLIDNVLLG